jgi:hypothetical protein
MSRDEPDGAGGSGAPGEAAEAGSPDVPGGQSRLERRYRRLLACYPADHRRAHGQEMLDVLMTGARAGQRSPGLAESADLIWGAVQVRIRPGASADPGWREALALLSVILPMVMVVDTVAASALTQSENVLFDPLALAANLIVQGQLVVAILVLLRLRRVAATVSVGMLIWYAVIAATGPGTSAYDPPAGLMFYLFLFGLEAVALVASPGPQRGLRLLNWRRSPLLLVAGVAVAIVQTSVNFHRGWGHDVIAVAGIVAIVVLAAGMGLASRTSRRILVLLTVPAYCLAASLLIGGVSPGPVTLASALVVDLPPLAILGLAVTAARRSGTRRPTG